MRKYWLWIILVTCTFGSEGRNALVWHEHGPEEEGSMYFADTLTLPNFLTGKYDYTKRPEFKLIDEQHAIKAFYLQEETYNAFKEMYDAAQKDGIRLKIVSATRSFQEQKNIWEWKWKEFHKKGVHDETSIAKNILHFSLMPGTSRHHWGTDIDLNNINNSYFEKGYGKKVYEWLLLHAGEYGFCQVYSDPSVEERNGCNLEKWHWSYLPLANQYIAAYNQFVGYQDLNGFSGAELAHDLSVIDTYVNGVSTQCNQ